MKVEDLILAKHESAHVAMAMILGGKVTEVSAAGGSGRTTHASKTLDTPVVTIASLLWAPTEACQDDAAQLTEWRNMPGGEALMTESRHRAEAIIATPEFRRLARAIEKELVAKRTLTEADVERIFKATKHVAASKVGRVIGVAAVENLIETLRGAIDDWANAINADGSLKEGRVSGGDLVENLKLAVWGWGFRQDISASDIRKMQRVAIQELVFSNKDLTVRRTIKRKDGKVPSTESLTKTRLRMLELAGIDILPGSTAKAAPAPFSNEALASGASTVEVER